MASGFSLTCRHRRQPWRGARRGDRAYPRLVTAGVRAAFVASQHAARRMVLARRGLIVHISFWAAQKYGGNAIYGLAKAATDKMTSDMAHELRPHGVAVVSLYPGLVRTEAVLAAGVFDLTNSESPEFIGRAIAALASDSEVLRRSGSVVVAAALATEYGCTDGGRVRKADAGTHPGVAASAGPRVRSKTVVIAKLE